MTTAQDTKLKIVEAAHTLFVSNGVEGTTMVSVASALGISRRTIYTHFRDKQSLILAVIERELEIMSQSLSTVMQREGDSISKLMVLLDRHLRLVQEAVQRQGSVNADFFSDTFNVERLRLKYDRSEYDMIKRILRSGIKRGELNVQDVNSTAYLILKSYKGLEAPYINRYHHDYGKEDYLRITSSMEQLLRTGLGAKAMDTTNK